MDSMKILLGLGLVVVMCVTVTGEGNSGNGVSCYTCREKDYDKCDPGEEEECKGNSKTHCMTIVKSKKKGDYKIEKMCVNPNSKCCEAGDYCKKSCGVEICYHCCNSSLCNIASPPEIVTNSTWDYCESDNNDNEDEDANGEDAHGEDDQWSPDLQWDEDDEEDGECSSGVGAIWRVSTCLLVLTYISTFLM